MGSDYSAIEAEHCSRLREDFERVANLLTRSLYSDRTHFVYELLQNAEDALARRQDWVGSRAVTFGLRQKVLRVSHFGEPFDEADVRSICSIGESTKNSDLTAIGKFGIGFKSVYAFTAAPQIHSGDEHFEIESYVWPRAIPSDHGNPDETVFELPFRPDDASAAQTIADRLKKLGLRTLLFLKQIDQIVWSVADGRSGSLRRAEPQEVGGGARKVTVVGEDSSGQHRTDEWLVFGREVVAGNGAKAGSVEIAFAKPQGCSTLRPVAKSRLVVSFPTVVETHLGFIVQGPFRTNLSRENVPENDSWNQRLVRETAELLGEALRGLRDIGLLDPGAMSCLPLERGKLAPDSLFLPLFDSTRQALLNEPLLPCHGGGHAVAASVRMAHSKELRDLLSPAQLASILGEREVRWLEEGITRDRAPLTYRYCVDELRIAEVTAERLLSGLSATFLQDQDDEWVSRLYRYLTMLTGQLRTKLVQLPLVRLEGGRHVVPSRDGHPQAYLPGPKRTDFPTVRQSMLELPGVKGFLVELGLTEPCPVDDAIQNILPRYASSAPQVTPEQFAADIDLLVRAFGTDSSRRKDELVSAAREHYLLAAVDASSGAKRFAKPAQVYISSQRLRALFDGVPSVLLADDSFECLRGQSVRAFFVQCGAPRWLERFSVTSRLDDQARAELRRLAGWPEKRREEPPLDYDLRGLSGLFELLPQLPPDERVARSRYLWDALRDFADNRGAAAFLGTYEWFYRTTRSSTFDAYFVKRLNQALWVPDEDGQLRSSRHVAFEETGWQPHPLLQSTIQFKPSVLHELAGKAGIDVRALQLLKEEGVTAEAGVRELLQLRDRHARDDDTADGLLRLLHLAGVTDEDQLRELLELRNTTTGEAGSWVGVPAALPEGRTPTLSPALGQETAPTVVLRQADPGALLRRIQEWWTANPHLGAEYDQTLYHDGGAFLCQIGRPYTSTPAEREAWLTLFLRGALESIGRANEAQHRTFVQQVTDGGWLRRLAADPSASGTIVEDLRNQLGQKVQDVPYAHWLRFYLPVAVFARWVDEYASTFLDAERLEGSWTLANVLAPRTMAQLSGGGWDAPPLACVLDIGACFVVRELLRRRVLRRKRWHQYAYLPTAAVRRLVERLGGPAMDEDRRPSQSKAIHQFLKASLDDPTFGGAFDLPLQRLAYDPDMRRQALGPDWTD